MTSVEGSGLLEPAMSISCGGSGGLARVGGEGGSGRGRGGHRGRSGQAPDARREVGGGTAGEGRTLRKPGARTAEAQLGK